MEFIMTQCYDQQSIYCYSLQLWQLIITITLRSYDRHCVSNHRHVGCLFQEIVKANNKEAEVLASPYGSLWNMDVFICHVHKPCNDCSVYVTLRPSLITIIMSSVKHASFTFIIITSLHTHEKTSQHIGHVMGFILPALKHKDHFRFQGSFDKVMKVLHR